MRIEDLRMELDCIDDGGIGVDVVVEVVDRAEQSLLFDVARLEKRGGRVVVVLGGQVEGD